MRTDLPNKLHHPALTLAHTAGMAVPFDRVYHNMTAKAMAMLLDDAGGGPNDPTEQDWIDLAALAGYKGEL